MAELTIIVVGVLIALAVQSWNEGRVGRATERQYLERLATDLASDTATFGLILGLANDALLALEHVRAVLEADPGEPIDTVRFLDDVRVGAGLGWNTPLYNRATFDDLLSTGNLSLIRDTELRDALVDYYRGSDDVRARIERRRGDYPMAGFELVPIPVDPPYRNVFDPESTEQSLASILRSVRESRLQSLVTGQENLTAFVAFLHGPLRARALELLSMLDDRLD